MGGLLSGYHYIPACRTTYLHGTNQPRPTSASLIDEELLLSHNSTWPILVDITILPPRAGRVGETDTVASGAVTVANGATFVEDFGVFYASSGTQLTPVAASPAQGQYIAPSGSPGAYTFNSADNGAAVLIYYSYTIASGNKISLANQLTGPLPMFEVSLKETFTYFGASKDIVVKLNACVSPKLSLPFSNQKFTVAELDFQAIADASNNIGTISLSE